MNKYLSILITAFVMSIGLHSFAQNLKLKVFYTQVKDSTMVEVFKGKTPTREYCGYMTETNTVLIEAQYMECGNFINNEATVKIYGYDIFDKDNIYNLYCINPKNEIIHRGACKGFSGLFSKDYDAFNSIIK